MPEFEGAKEPVPDGVFPLFLTMTTQEHYGVHVCTLEDQYRWVPKQTFIDEIKFKGAISDMYVIKKEIEKYKGDELMIHFDDDEIFGQNFFVCVKPDAALPWVAAQEVREQYQALTPSKRPAEELEEGIPNYRHLVERSVSAKPIKQVCSGRDRRRY